MDTPEADAFFPLRTQTVLGAHNALAPEKHIPGIALPAFEGLIVKVPALGVDGSALGVRVRIEPLRASHAHWSPELSAVKITDCLYVLHTLATASLVAGIAGQASGKLRVEASTERVHLSADAVGIEVETS